MVNKKTILLVLFFLKIMVSYSQLLYGLSDVKYAYRYYDFDKDEFYYYDFYKTFVLNTNLNKIKGDVDVFTAAKLAASKWNNVSNSFYNIKIVQSSEENGVLEDPLLSIINKIGFTNTNISVSQYKWSNNLINGEEAIAYTSFTRDAVRCKYWQDPILDGADIVLNPSILIKIKNKDSLNISDGEYDLINILIHELGHAGGLRHHPKAIEGVDVMYPSMSDKSNYRTLSPLDEFAIHRLYGGFDIGQVSSIPCALFEQKKAAGLIAEDTKSGGSPGTTPCISIDNIRVNNAIYPLIPCISKDIVITPSQKSFCLNQDEFYLGAKKITLSETEIIDRGWDKNLCDGAFFGSKDHCYYYEYDIYFWELPNLAAAQLPKSNWNLVSSKRYQVQINDNDRFDFGGTLDFINVSAITVNENDLDQLNSGSYHVLGIREILLADTFSALQPFRYIKDNLLLKDKVVSKDKIAGTITMDNVQVNDNIEVQANQYIRITNGTRLKSGHYFTASSPSCGSFTGKKSMVQNNNSSSTAETALMDLLPIVETPETSIPNPTLSPQNIKIYPNPSRGIFVVELGEGAYTQIQIIDFLGRQVYSRQILGNRMEIDITNFSNGLYSVLITNEQGVVYSQKVVKN